MGKPDTKTFTKKVTLATTDTQIFISPWRIRKRYTPTRMIISNSGNANNIKFFDDDLADATTPARGDHTDTPLLEIQIGAATTIFIDDNQLPYEFYQGGMVAYAAVANPVITVEVKED